MLQVRAFFAKKYEGAKSVGQSLEASESNAFVTASAAVGNKELLN